MVEILPPNLNIPTETPPSGNSVNGTVDISSLPELSSLKPGMSVMLEIIRNSGITNTKQLAVNINSSLTETFLKIPVTLNLEQPIDLPTETTQIAARVTAQNNGRIELRLNTLLSPLSEEGNTASDTAPAVSINRTEALNLSLPPLKGFSLVEQATKELELPPKTTELLGEAVKNIKIPLTLQQVIMTATPTSSQISLAEPPIIGSIMPELTEIITQSDFTNPRELPQLAQRIFEILQPLSGQSMIARSIALPESALMVLQTPLGEVVPDFPLKLLPDTMVRLQLGPVSINEKSQGLLPELVNSRQLLQNLISLEALLQPRPGEHRLGQQALTDFLKIFSPLQNHVEQPVLAAKILSRLPAPNSGFLSNIRGFIRAAESGDISRWLGSEMTSSMRQLGTEGQETIGNLQNFVAANSKEGISWRVVEIPFFTGDAISKIRIAIKKNEEEEKEGSAKKGKNGTRFVVDTNFSKLGRFQFDGFSFAKDRRFDLIIRTGLEIPKGLIAEMMRIFKNTLHVVGYVGNVQVNVKENFIKVCEDVSETTLNKEGIYI